MSAIFNTLNPSNEFPELVALAQYLRDNVTEELSHPGSQLRDFKWETKNSSESTAVACLVLTEKDVPVLEIFLSETTPGLHDAYDPEGGDMLDHLISEDPMDTCDSDLFNDLLGAIFDYRLELQGDAYLRDDEDEVLWFAIEHKERTIEVKFFKHYEEQL